MKKKTLKRIKQNKKTKKVYRGGESLINKKDRKNALKSLCTQILERKKENKDNCILVHFLTDDTNGILKYPTIPKSTIPKSARQTVDTFKRKTLGNNPRRRHIVIITEFRNINNTQEKFYEDDIYHYILIFDTTGYENRSNNDNIKYNEYVKYSHIKTFFNTFKNTYDNTDISDKFKYLKDLKFNLENKDEEDFYVPNKFENVFVTKKLSFCDMYDNKNKTTMKIINLTKCDFKEQKFVEPLLNNNQSNYYDVDLIIKNEYVSNGKYTNMIFMSNIHKIIQNNNDNISEVIDERTLTKNVDMLESALTVMDESIYLHNYNYEYTLSYSYDFIRSKKPIDKNVKVKVNDKNVKVNDINAKYINFRVNIDQPKTTKYIKPKIPKNIEPRNQTKYREINDLDILIKKINKEWKKSVCLSII